MHTFLCPPKPQSAPTRSHTEWFNARNTPSRGKRRFLLKFKKTPPQALKHIIKFLRFVINSDTFRPFVGNLQGMYISVYKTYVINR